MVELKPCPFCGGEAYSEEQGGGEDDFVFTDDEFQKFWTVGCDRGECSYAHIAEPTEAEAIEAWNTRAPIPETTPVSDISETIIPNQPVNVLVGGGIRICPERDGPCPHGAPCPHSIDRYHCRSEPNTPTQHKPDSVSGVTKVSRTEMQQMLNSEPTPEAIEVMKNGMKMAEELASTGSVNVSIGTRAQFDDFQRRAREQINNGQSVENTGLDKHLLDTTQPVEAEIEPVAWRADSWDITLYKSIADKWLSDARPLYSQAQINKMQSERDEARRESDAWQKGAEDYASRSNKAEAINATIRAEHRDMLGKCVMAIEKRIAAYPLEKQRPIRDEIYKIRSIVRALAGEEA